MIGFDPGTVHLGYAVLDEGPRYVECGVIDAPARWSRWQRLAEMRRELVALLVEHKPTHAALEGGVDKYATAALAGGEIRGVILCALLEAGMPSANITEHAPAAVKLAIAGAGNASKTELARAMCSRLKLRTMPPADATDALAVAACGLLGAALTLPKRRPRRTTSARRRCS